MSEAQKCGVKETLKLFFLKFIFSFKNPIIKMNNYDFPIQDVVQGCPLQS